MACTRRGAQGAAAGEARGGLTTSMRKLYLAWERAGKINRRKHRTKTTYSAIGLPRSRARKTNAPVVRGAGPPPWSRMIQVYHKNVKGTPARPWDNTSNLELGISPVLIPELALEHLAHRAAGQLVHEIHGAGLEVAGQLGAAEIDDFLGAALGPGPQHHHRLEGLAPLVVRHPDHRHLGDLGMPKQHLLHLAGVDVLPPADDHVNAAVHDVEKALLVHAAHVAQGEPAVLEGGGGLFRVAVIATEQAGATHVDLAHPARGHRPARFVQQLDIGVPHRPAHRADLALHVRGLDVGHDQGLGGRVELIKHWAEALQGRLLDRGGQRRAPAHEHPEAGGVVDPVTRQGQDGAEHGGHQEAVGHLIAGHQAQVLLRVEALHDHGGAAHVQGQGGEVARRGVPEGPGVQGDLARAQAVVQHLVQVAGHNGPVGGQRPLGAAGGAPGVADEQDVLGAQVHVRLALVGRGQERFVAVHARRRRLLAQDHYPALHRLLDLPLQAVEQDQILRPQHQGRGLGVAQAVAHLRGLEAVVDGHQPHPELGAGVVDLQKLRPIEGQHRHLVALGQAPGAQHRAQAVDPAVELVIGPRAVLKDDRGPVGMAFGAAAQGPAHEHGVSLLDFFSGAARGRPGHRGRLGRGRGRPALAQVVGHHSGQHHPGGHQQPGLAQGGGHHQAQAAGHGQQALARVESMSQVTHKAHLQRAQAQHHHGHHRDQGPGRGARHQQQGPVVGKDIGHQKAGHRRADGKQSGLNVTGLGDAAGHDGGHAHRRGEPGEGPEVKSEHVGLDGLQSQADQGGDGHHGPHQIGGHGGNLQAQDDHAAHGHGQGQEQAPPCPGLPRVAHQKPQARLGDQSDNGPQGGASHGHLGAGDRAFHTALYHPGQRWPGASPEQAEEEKAHDAPKGGEHGRVAQEKQQHYGQHRQHEQGGGGPQLSPVGLLGERGHPAPQG
eukprot:TRINITY_DN18447_c2_g1_i1.p1 TRINITY_DN18447_c2_g1~~TRINITY_DN18447_c2_g1_i1.p1  ORF type:complete len:944 (+),score=289.22 TRINITY_DN18447_c2_g1_i1:617-3448(+)